MKHLFLLACLSFALCVSLSEIQSEEVIPIEDSEKVFDDIDLEDDHDEDSFEKEFELEEVTDPEEKEKRQEALKENEKLVKEENEEFLNGKKTWFDKISEFSDLPENEFEQEKTGEILPVEAKEYGRGLLEAVGPERRDEASERYFDQFRYSRSEVPSSFNSVDNGHVSSVKNQKNCGSCVAFANMALIETCFKKLTGVFGDYSEQELVDCGYGQNGAKGCNGAWPFAYAKWTADGRKSLTHESRYPYLNKEPRLTCPTNLEAYNQGAQVTESYYTYEGDEELMKRLVVEHGAVQAGVRSAGPFQEYSGGVFAGCTSDNTDHAVTVVGFGTDNGVDFWLIKNSWGPDWGEQGYIRLKRGVGMCGIGSVIVTVSCGSVDGPTDAPLTTATPCVDKYTNCPELALTNCHGNSEHCAKSCGLCEGMTPEPSNVCYNTFNNCDELAKTECYNYPTECCISCGLGEGMTPATSNTCYDKWSNCAEIAENKCYKDKYKTECCISCGLGEGMTPAASNTCFNKYGNCGNYCESKRNAKNCKKACGTCEE